MRVLPALALALLPGTVAIAVKSKVISVTGQFCGGSTLNGTVEHGTYKATVWYPTDDSKKYPVLSFAHGMTVWDPRVYVGTIAGVAEAGYIVIALNGCTLAMNEWKAQVSSLTYMLTQEKTLKNIIDYNAPTGVFGHSMGGASTICAASDADSVKTAKIAAAVSMHPGVQIGPSRPIIPILYFAGQLDTVVPSVMVKAEFDLCPHKVDRGYAVFSGYTHMGPTGPWSNHEIEWTVAMMDCHVKKHTTGCTKVFGNANGQGSMCSAGQTSHCETHRAPAGSPSPETVVV